MYAACSQIPAGRVSTYGELARALDSSARAVGGALRKNPFAPVVPCHRVVASDGSLGGFSGVWRAGAPELLRKEALLRSEGVCFATPARGAPMIASAPWKFTPAAIATIPPGGVLRARALCAKRERDSDEPTVSPAHGDVDERTASSERGDRRAAAEGHLACRQQIIGIDWSGARNAGERIFLAHGSLAPLSTALASAPCAPPAVHVLVIDRVVSAAAALGPVAPLARSLEAGTDAVVRFLLSTHQLAAAQEELLTCGVDAPLGLPAALADAALGGAHDARGSDSGERWRDLVSGCAARWPHADSLREWSLALAARAQAADDGSPTGAREPKRACDVASRAPFAPTNLRLYRQTWAALALLCAPLLDSPDGREGRVAVLPMMRPSAARAQLRLLEACPASLLKRTALYDAPYKGTTAAHATARKRLVAHARDVGFELVAGGSARVRVHCEPAVEAVLIGQASGDALDAVLAAAATACSVLRPGFPAPVEGAHALHALEGAIYY